MTGWEAVLFYMPDPKDNHQSSHPKSILATINPTWITYRQMALLRVISSLLPWILWVTPACRGYQFYQFWHANYNDHQIMCDLVAIKSIVSGEDEFGLAIPTDVRLRALAVKKVAPVVEIGEETVTVNLVVFTKWGGFYRTTFTIRRSQSPEILDIQNDVLVPYDCGLAF